MKVVPLAEVQLFLDAMYTVKETKTARDRATGKLLHDPATIRHAEMRLTVAERTMIAKAFEIKDRVDPQAGFTVHLPDRTIRTMDRPGHIYTLVNRGQEITYRFHRAEGNQLWYKPEEDRKGYLPISDKNSKVNTAPVEVVYTVILLKTDGRPGKRFDTGIKPGVQYREDTPSAWLTYSLSEVKGTNYFFELLNTCPK